MDVVERYNLLLRTLEDDTVLMLDRILDAGFNRLVRRTRIHMKAGYTDPAQRNLALLQEFRQLVPVFRADRIDAYDRILRLLLQTAARYGVTVATELGDQAKPGPRVDVSIPLEATAAAAAQAKGYLRKHGERFAATSAATIAQGVAEGRPTDAMVQDLRSRLGVVKSRAEAIVRTESLRAYNDASNTYYAAQGIELVMYYATADDRACPICAPRAGNIYRRQDIRVPLHPRCRCYLAPWDADIASMDQNYADMRKAHKKEVEQAVQRLGAAPVSLNKAAVFEQIAPVPVS
jgi:SPP1 gp7 family putative phage head morphogenesis protein